MTPPLLGGGFTSNWNDLTAGDLFERIRLTMPLDRPGKLTRQQNADVIAFVMRANAWPAGKSELPPDAARPEADQDRRNRSKPTLPRSVLAPLARGGFTGGWTHS